MYLESPKHNTPAYAFGLVIALFLSTTTRSFADGQMYFLGRRIGTRVRAAIIAELYSKSLARVNQVAPSGSDSGKDSKLDDSKDSKKAQKNANSGEIINLMVF
jgi:hypothetical protein